MKKIFALFLVLAMSPATGLFAEGTHPEKEFFKGSGFDLVKVNDVMVGLYNLMPIWADKACGDHIKGLYKAGKDIGEFSVVVKDKKPMGTFGENTVSFVRIDKEKKAIVLQSSAGEVYVYYSYAGTNGEHMMNIDFRFDGLNGRQHHVMLEGECCLGSVIFYSIFLYGVTGLSPANPVPGLFVW
ncbi:MAG: hypothetical protein ABIG11_03470 [bacterium]